MSVFDTPGVRFGPYAVRGRAALQGARRHVMAEKNIVRAEITHFA